MNRIEARREAFFDVKESVVHTEKIGELTHNLYKYPACFPPTFPRAVIANFTKEDDWVLDPFVGGGTTAVEALAANRNFVGSDLNDLAIFASKFKTTILDLNDVLELEKWLDRRDVKKDATAKIQDSRLYENVPLIILNFAKKMKTSILSLKRPRNRVFATGVLLRFLQYEVDRENSAHLNLDSKYRNLFSELIEKNVQFRNSIDSRSLRFRPTSGLFQADVADPSIVMSFQKHNREFDLVVTSPPYPQRHILYNKWQVRGRSETRLPYFIIGSDQLLDESH